MSVRTATPTATPTTAPSHPSTTSQVSKELIAKRAYEKWVQRGCPHGSDHIDWYEAERELTQRTTTTTTRR